MKIIDFTLNVLVSSLTGVAASFFGWWYTFKYLVPKIRFGECISKLETSDNASGFRYRFKFENYGRRNIIDIDVVVRLRIKGLKSDFPNNWAIIYIPTSENNRNIFIVRPITKGNLRYIVEIKTHDCQFFQKTFLPQEIINKSINKTLTFEDVLKLGLESEFQIMLTGIDEFSGAKKFFESKVFSINDIKNGRFEKNGLSIIEVEKK